MATTTADADVQDSDELTGGGLEDQLMALYDERERLAAEIGVCDADGIVQLVSELQAPDQSLVDQVVSLYAERDRLHQELGVTSADDIIAHVRTLERKLDAITSTLNGLTSIIQEN